MNRFVRWPSASRSAARRRRLQLERLEARDLLFCGYEITPAQSPALAGSMFTFIDRETDALVIRFENPADAEGVEVHGFGISSATPVVVEREEGLAFFQQLHSDGRRDQSFRSVALPKQVVEATSRVDLTAALLPPKAAGGLVELRIPNFSRQVLEGFTPVEIPASRMTLSDFVRIDLANTARDVELLVEQLPARVSDRIEITRTTAAGSVTLLDRFTPTSDGLGDYSGFAALRRPHVDVRLASSETVVDDPFATEGLDLVFGDPLRLAVDVCNAGGKEQTQRSRQLARTADGGEFQIEAPAGIYLEDVLQNLHVGRDDPDREFHVAVDFGEDGAGQDGVEVLTFQAGRMHLSQTLTHVYGAPGAFTARVEIHAGPVIHPVLKLAVDRLEVSELITVTQAGVGVEAQPFVGRNELFEIDKFDVAEVGRASLLSLNIDPGLSTLRAGAIHGRLAGGVVADVDVAVVVPRHVRANQEANGGNGIGFDFARFNPAMTDDSELAMTQVTPADGALHRAFSFNLDDLLRSAAEDSAFDAAAFLPRHALSDTTEGLIFLLIDRSTGQELDRIVLAAEDVQGLAVGRAGPFVEEAEIAFGRVLQPLDVDLQIDRERLEKLADGDFEPLNVVVTADNILANVRESTDDATLVIDFGDGSDPVITRIDPRRSRDSGELNDGVFAANPQSLLAEFSRGPFSKEYDAPGEYTVTVTLTLPTGQVAGEQRRVTVVDPQPLADVRFQLDRFDRPGMRVDHTGAGTARFRLNGEIANAQLNEEVTFVLRVGDREQTIVETLGGIGLDQRGFDLTFDELNLLDFLPADRTFQPLDGVLTVSGASFETTALPVQAVVDTQAIFLRNYSDDSIHAYGVGDQFEISVPVSGFRFGEGQVDDTAVFMVPAANNLTLIAFQSEIVTGLSGVTIRDGDIVIRSSVLNPETDERISLAELTFPTSQLDVPAVTILPELKHAVVNFEGVDEAPEGGDARNGLGINFINLENGDEVEVDYGNGDLRRVTFDTAQPGNELNALFDNAYADDPPGTGRDDAFTLSARMIRGGQTVAEAQRSLIVNDRGAAGLSLDVETSPAAARLDPLGERELTLEITARDEFTDGSLTSDTLTVTVFWRDGNTDAMEIPNGGSLSLSHTYERLFLEEMTAVGSTTVRYQVEPIVVLADDDGSIMTDRVVVSGRQRMEVDIADGDALRRAQLKSNSGPEIPAGKAFFGEPVDITLLLTNDDRNAINRLNPGEEFSLFVDPGVGEAIELVGTNDGGSAQVHVRQADDSQGVELDYNPSRGELGLRSRATGVPLLAYSSTGVYRIRAFTRDLSDDFRAAYGVATLAVYPRLNGLIGANGKARFVAGVGTLVPDPALAPSFHPRMTVTVPGRDIESVIETDFGDALPLENGENLAFEFRAGESESGPTALPFDVAVGGELLVELDAGLFDQGDVELLRARLRIPFTFGEGAVRPIGVSAPAKINQNVAVPLQLTLSETDRQLANSDTLQLRVDLGNGTKFDLLHGTNTPEMRFEVFDAIVDVASQPPIQPDAVSARRVAYDPASGVISLNQFAGGEPFARYGSAGLFEIRAAGRDSFGNAVISVADEIPLLSTVFQQDAAGRLLEAFLDIDSQNGVELEVLGQSLEIDAGNQRVRLLELGQQLLPGESIPFSLTEAGESVELESSLLIPPGDSLDVEVNDLAARQIPGRILEISGTLADATLAVTIVVSDERSNQLGQFTTTAGEGAFDFTVSATQGEADRFVRLAFNNGQALSFDVVEFSKPLLIDATAERTTEQGSPLDLSLNLVPAESSDDDDLVKVVLGTTNGELEGTFDGQVQRGTVLDIEGTLADVQAFLPSVTYHPAEEFIGVADVGARVEDLADETSVDVRRIVVTVTPRVEFDFGDAPAPYPTLLADDGARHRLPGPRLGVAVDADNDGRPTQQADGDDTDASPNDEDGVRFVTSLVATDEFATTATVVVEASEVARLDAWIDFDGNGVWESPEEQMFASIELAPAMNSLSFTIPAGTATGVTAARFRISRDGGLLPTGEAADGEVEDYLVEIQDGDVGDADVSIALAAPGQLDVQVDGTDIVVRSAGSELFRGPAAGLGRLTLQGTDGDDEFAIGRLDPEFTGEVRVEAGEGSDTIRLNGAGQQLDLVAAPDGSFQSIELIDITGSGDNLLRLDAAEVLDLSPVTETLTVIADAGDRVFVGDGWTLSATEFEDGRLVRVLTQNPTLRLIGPNDWRNPLDPLDVNADGLATPIDVLVIINEINDPQFSAQGVLADPAGLSSFPRRFYDTNGDDAVTPNDALRVINFLNGDGPPESEGEGEGNERSGPRFAAHGSAAPAGGRFSSLPPGSARIVHHRPLDLQANAPPPVVVPVPVPPPQPVVPVLPRAGAVDEAPADSLSLDEFQSAVDSLFARPVDLLAATTR